MVWNNSSIITHICIGTWQRPTHETERDSKGDQRKIHLFFFSNFYLFILFMAVLGLRFCARAFSSCAKWGPLFIAMHGPLTIAASLVAEHRLQTRRLSNCGSRAQLLCGMWDLPRPGLEPVCPALAGRFSTTAPPGKPGKSIFAFHICSSHSNPARFYRKRYKTAFKEFTQETRFRHQISKAT